MKRSSAALLLGFGLLIALVVATLVFVGLQAKTSRDAVEQMRTQQALDRILQLLADAETGQRGYLLTGTESYLAPYDQGVAEIDTTFQSLVNDVARAGDEINDIVLLRSLADRKLVELKTTIDLERAGRHAEALALVETGVGKTTMERIRGLIGDVAAAQQQRFARSSTTSQGLARWLQGIAALTIFVAGGLCYWAVQQSRNQVVRLASAEARERATNAELVAQARERERLADQLRQSQKMEAIGQLTGGVAHDFNNMLAVVIGSLNLLKRRHARGDTDIMRFVDGALDGAERASTLTHRLLAFSRQQPLVPLPLDPNRTVQGMAEMLRRTLGEQTRLETVLGGGLWRTLVDASELENSILNLAVNARDAMAEGGCLTVETSNAHLDTQYAAEHVDIPPGQYVLLAVSDTGCGMTKDVAARVFEPFFTTKADGHGTGLGLSQVYGFVRQSGGHVKVYSEVGKGTTIKIYLPRYYGSEEAAAPVTARAAALRGSRGEIILVVEDDDDVRRVAVETLRDLGYGVLHAAHGAAALDMLDANPGIVLLFTDIVMPQMNGRELADRARALRPDLRVLFTTGYTRNAVVHNGVVDPGVDLISKPYGVDDLARRVRDILDRSVTASQSTGETMSPM